MAGDKAETGRRLTVPEAAAELGTTSEGVRSRIKRGTLRTERESGRVWVILDTDQPRPGGAPTGGRAADRAELVDELRERVAFLERELETRTEENRRKDHLLAAALERIPAIEAPESPETPAESAPNTTGGPEAETPAEPRPWWRRVFGG
jgi:hypothetical protein